MPLKEKALNSKVIGQIEQSVVQHLAERGIDVWSEIHAVLEMLDPGVTRVMEFVVPPTEPHTERRVYILG